MRIQPIQQPTFQMKWENRVLPNVTNRKIELDNGKKLLVRDGGWYKLQSLYDEIGRWVKSQLRYYKGRQVIKQVESYNQKENNVEVLNNLCV